jgi:hypothetical protein
MIDYAVRIKTPLVASGCEQGEGTLFSAPICGVETLAYSRAKTPQALVCGGRK